SSMLLAALAARNLAVGDVAEEHVPECVLVLPGDRRTTSALHELLALEPVQHLLGHRPWEFGDDLERTHPEHLPYDGRALDEPLLVVREGVESGRDDALHALGKLVEL